MSEEHVNMHGLGRLKSVDERDRNYLLPRRAVAPPKISSKYWYIPPPLDQGSTSSCVGHAWFQYLRASPIRNKNNIPDPFEIYRQAQKIDEWPGEEPLYEGTSVRAGAKYLKANGFISSYSWAFDGATVINHLLSSSPVVIGVDWMEGMMSTDKKGFIYPRGRLLGGHAVVLNSVNTTGKCPDGRIGYCGFPNSWGREWGANGGRAFMALEDLDMLIKSQGEACVAHEILKPIPVV
jgi:hypothetical protein